MGQDPNARVSDCHVGQMSLSAKFTGLPCKMAAFKWSVIFHSEQSSTAWRSDASFTLLLGLRSDGVTCAVASTCRHKICLVSDEQRKKKKKKKKKKKVLCVD